MSDQTSDLRQLIKNAIRANPEAGAIQFQGHWKAWSTLTVLSQRIIELLDGAKVGVEFPVGLVARNRPGHIAAMTAALLSERCIGMMYSTQSPERMATDITKANFAAVIADEQDWNVHTIAAAKQIGCVAIAINSKHTDAFYVDSLKEIGPQSHTTVSKNVALFILSSGTTGHPKRIPIRFDTLCYAVMDGIKGSQQQTGSDQDKTPVIFHSPLGNITGVQYTVRALVEGRPIVLMEKFSVDEWLLHVRTYRPVLAFLPPVGVGMVLQANVNPEDLASIKVIRTGGAPLEPALHRAFEEKFGVPVLVTYGATEFCGVIIAWTPEDYKLFGNSKRGSVGRPRPGVSVRVAPLESEGDGSKDAKVGRLEALVPWVSDQWIATTDLASIDQDGFIFLGGRTDQSINRGGFKMAPLDIETVLRKHPSISEVAVIGLKDARLGEVPVAALEVKPGEDPPTEAAILSFAKRHLLAYQVPARVLILKELPRTESLKVHLLKVRELFA